jgi:hypothetical protein
MLEKRGEPNPLELFNIRRLKYEAPHLKYIDIPLSYNIEQALVKWINYHLKNRYYIGRTMSLDSENQISNQIRIGFEDPKEMSYFVLACPHLKYN